MQIEVTQHYVKLAEEDIINKGEYSKDNVSFTFSDEYTSDLTKRALFTKDNTTYEVDIIEDKCSIPVEISKTTGSCILGVYAYKIEDEMITLRYSPKPTRFSIEEGSYVEDTEASEEISASELAQYRQTLDTLIAKVTEKLNSLSSTSELNIIAGDNVSINKADNNITISAAKQTDNNYTNEEKTKLAGLNNYDDTNVVSEITTIENRQTASEDNIISNTTKINDLETKINSIGTSTGLMQYTEFPEASESNKDKIVQYIGSSSAYTFGYFYRCVLNDTNESVRAEQISGIGLGSIEVDLDTYFQKMVDSDVGIQEENQFSYKGYPETIKVYSALTESGEDTFTRDRDLDTTRTEYDNVGNAEEVSYYGWISSDSGNAFYTRTAIPQNNDDVYIKANEDNFTMDGAIVEEVETLSPDFGYWVLDTDNDDFEETLVDLDEYGITFNGNERVGDVILVTYTFEDHSGYSWQQINVQPV